MRKLKEKGGESAFLAGLQDVKSLVRAANCTVKHSGRLCRRMADIKGLETWPGIASMGDLTWRTDRAGEEEGKLNRSFTGPRKELPKRYSKDSQVFLEEN